jgi:hypothetical protein
MLRIFHQTLMSAWLMVGAYFKRSATPAAYSRQTWRTNARAMGVRMNERVRGRFRRAWLVVVRHGPA